MEDKIFIRDCCSYTLEKFFEKEIPGCKVDDGNIVILDKAEYQIWPMKPVGMDTQRDIYFYRLELIK